MKTPLILIGGGGHCKSVIDVIESTEQYEIVGILDKPELVGQDILGYKVIGSDDDIAKFHEKGASFLITVGQIKSCTVRIKIATKIAHLGGSLATVVSPFARVSPWASLGKGVVVMHHALVNASAVVKDHCIINNGALVEHDAYVDEFCHVSTHAVLNGNVSLGKGCFIGSNSVIAHGVKLMSNAVVGAGSVVIRNVDQNIIVIGNPAREI